MRYFKFLGVLGVILQSISCQSETFAMPWFENLSPAEKYQAVSPADQVELEHAFLSLFRDLNADGLEKFYEITAHTEDDLEVLLGASSAELGWGAFAYQAKSKKPVFLQTPHRYFDVHTGLIAETGWRQGLAQVYMTNSIHRSRGQQQNPRINSDISNAARSALLAASEAWVAVNPDGLIVQLHGYAKDNRITEAGRSADIIISHGTDQLYRYGTRLQRIQECLVESLEVTVLRYPEQIGELGGTQNNVAQALASWGKSEQFIHVEMSRGVRDLLAVDQAKTLEVLQCIVGDAKE